MSDQPCQVPLAERLRSVPANAREMIEINATHHRNIPYGAMCHEAADAIEKMRTALEYNRQEMLEAAVRTGVGELLLKTEVWRLTDGALNIPAKQ